MKKLLVGLLLIVSYSLFAQAPIITSFTPKTQIPGGLDTIYGSNFDTAITSNLVQFGSARATVISAIASRLIVQVPFGAKHGYITVLKISNGLKAFSKDKFLPTFNSPKTSYFEPSMQIKRRSQQQIAIGDMNLDGKQDLVVVDSMGRGINIYQNINSPGQLNPDSFVLIGTITTFMGANGWCNSIKLADLNGDGKPEVLMNDVQTLTANLRVIRNNCTIGATMIPANFTAVNIYSSSTFTIQNFDVNDLNADGKADIALITRQGLLILRNNVISGIISGSSFVVSATLLSTHAFSDARDVRIGDLDNDGKNDIVFTTSINKAVLVVKNNAIANSTLPATDFSAFTILSNGVNSPNSLELADLDTDGRLDIVSGDGSLVKVFRNISISGTLNTSSFAPRMDLPNFGDFVRILVEDLNGDRKPDLILTNSFFYQSTTQFVENRIINGVFNECMFVKTLSIKTSDNGRVGMDIGDLNQDGLPDMVAVAINDSAMRFYKGTQEYRPLVLEAVPNFGFPGDTITINGINFSGNISTTLVKFGNANGQIISTNPTQIKVIVPTNAINDFIEINNNGSICYSPIKFTPTFKSEGGVYFRSNVNISVIPRNPMFIMSADLDNDRKPELITINQDSNLISIYRNISTTGTLNAASFAAPFYLRTNSWPDQIILSDLDMDGKNDLIVNYTTANSFSIFKNNYVSGLLSAASFSPIINLSRGLNGTANMFVTDIDLNGKPDIVNINPLYINYLLNETSVGVLDANSFSTNNFVTNVPVNSYDQFDAGDLDGDGKPEIVVSYDNTNHFTIYKNALSVSPDANSDGINIFYDIPYFRPGRVMIADIDMDRKNDIVVFNNAGDTVSVFKNISNTGCLTSSTFQRFDTKVLFTSSFSPKILKDINGDSKPDILSGTYSGSGGGELTAYLNTSSGNQISFTTNKLGNTVPGSLSLYLDDLDGDSIPDMMTGNYSSGSINSISLYKGIPLSTLPIIDYFTPIQSAIGLNDTIYGNFFNPIAANNIVKFGAVRATILNATKNRIIVKVPAGASYDRISVTTNGSTSLSGKKFLPVFSDTGSSFTPAMFSVIPITQSMFTGSLTDIQFDDVDMDGMPDLIAAGTSLSAFKNLLLPLDSINSAAFPLANTLAFGTARQLEIIDMNGDGKRDITVTNGSSQLNTFTNIATTGPINSGSYISSGFNMLAVATKTIGDHNNDNRPDLFIKPNANSMDTYRNNTANAGGAISYETTDCNSNGACSGSNYLAGGLLLADLDGDNKSEIITGCLGGFNNLTIRRYNKNNAGYTPTFTDQSFTLSTDTTPEIILYGDLDNDPKTDLLIVSRAGKSFCIHKNNYDGSNFSTTTFATKVSYIASTTLTPSCAELGDIDGDGRVDLAIGFTNGSFSLYRNVSQNGIINSSSFTPGINIPCSLTSIGSIKIQDINADGSPEVVVAGAAANNFAKVFVYRTNIQIPTPTIASSFLSFSNITANRIKVNWVNGNGTNRIVIASLTPILSNAQQNKTYQANNTFGLGDTIGGNQNFVIYNGNENSVTLFGLLPNTIYYFKVIEYNGKGINSVYFNTSTLTGNTATLPVTLLNFNVSACGEKCGELNWKTASEINNDKFEILRSLDGQVWDKIGEVKGHGTTKIVQQYKFIDVMNDLERTSIPSTLFYKLKQVDYDGSFAYSKIEILNFLNQTEELKIYPNPFTNQIFLFGLTQNNLKLSLFNSMGQLVFIGNTNSNESINLSKLGSGIYYLLVQNENGKLLFDGKVIKY